MEKLVVIFTGLIGIFLILLGIIAMLNPSRISDFAIKLYKLKEDTYRYKILQSNFMLICYRICGVAAILMGIISLLMIAYGR